MSDFRRAPVATLLACGLACALVAASVLVLPGCKPAKRDGPADRQAYELALGGSVGLSVDYETGKIAAAATETPRVVLGFSTKDEKGILTIDCSRLGGGSIAGRFRAFSQGVELERGEFDVLYQHRQEVVLAQKADTVQVTALRFTRVIE